MANMCFNKVYLVGDSEAVSLIADTITKLTDMNSNGSPTTTFEALQKALDFECENWGKSYQPGIAGMDVSRLEEGIIFLEGTTTWDGIPLYWEALCDRYNLQYVERTDVDGKIIIDGDPEKKWFPEYAILEVWKDHDRFGLTEQNNYIEFLSHKDLKRFVDEKEFGSIEDLSEFLIEEDIGELIVVDRYGEQVHLPLLYKEREDSDLER